MFRAQLLFLTSIMRRLLLFLFCSFLALSATKAHPQADGGEIVAGTSAVSYDLRPEFTARAIYGFWDTDYRITGGVMVNDKRTFGLMSGYHNTFLHVPGYLHAVNTSLYYRRYFHLGKRKTCAFYVDAYAGAEYVYKVTGKYGVDLETGKIEALFDDEPGDVAPIWGVHPGFRVRLYRNLHLFFGLAFSEQNFGLHLGVGF